MRADKLYLRDFRRFQDQEIYIGRRLTAIAGNNGTGKSTILGLLANSSQLDGCKTYLDRHYVGEFSELFSALEKHDPAGSKRLTLFYEENGIKKSADFRTTWQKKRNSSKKRFRVIPKRDAGGSRLVESKIPSPVIYLGLSRLYPVGEAKDEHVRRRAQAWDVEDDQVWFEERYKEIISMRDELKSVNRLQITGLGHKAGTGIETDTYGPAANSAGQDNLGQILMAILSFRKLKRELGAAWDGGLLLIDEIDAALHPAAQKRLIALLLKESKEIGLQVVFTTHSTVILEELAEKCLYNPSNEAGDVEIAYLTDANRSLRVRRNPTWPQMENDLLIRGSRFGEAKVGVFSEDEEARWLAKGILEITYPQVLERVRFLDLTFGWKQLLRLYRDDFLYLKDRIVLLDGDVTDDDICNRVSSKLVESGQNLIRLPGNVRPESLIHDFLMNLLEDDPLWEELDAYCFTYRILEERGPNSRDYASESEDRKRYKVWLRDYMSSFDGARVIQRWVELNEETAWDFTDDFVRAYNAVSKRTIAPEIPMAKRTLTS